MHSTNPRHSLIAIASLLALFGTITTQAQDTKEASLQAQLSLPFLNNAVLQQNISLPVWGMTLPGAQVTLAFDQQTKTTEADQDGRWRVTLEPIAAVKLTSVNDCPEGKTMTITCMKDGKSAVTEYLIQVMTLSPD